MARQYYKDSTTGQMKPIGVKVEDTLPVGTIIDYDGTDIPEGYEEVDDPNEYSTDEKRIGTWIDGKPLYRKVINLTNSTILYNGSTINTGISNLEDLIRLESYFSSGDGTSITPIPSYKSSTEYVRASFNKSNSTISIFAGSDYTQSTQRHIIFILEYTKTTD